MNVTIEADLENGKLKGARVGELPEQARVLVTVLSPKIGERPGFGTRTSGPVKMADNVFAPLSKEECLEWGM